MIAARRMLAILSLVLLVGCGKKAAAPGGATAAAPRVDCLTGEAVAGHIGACPITKASWRFAMTFLRPRGAKNRAHVMDALIARELLAQGAQEAGVPAVDKRAAMERIAKGELYVLGQRLGGDVVFSDGPEEGDRQFSARKFADLAGRLGLSMDELVAEQGREYLAAAMRTNLATSAKQAAWLTDQCRRGLDAGRIAVVKEVLADDSYVPCATPTDGVVTFDMDPPAGSGGPE